ncbi:UPF0182 protein [Rhizoctonia solani]|uniref:UPF0182 protein n=1 Tax=Rhizoctonia solani TaxID=456999 RepID=A0A0K6G2U8_9AGAM|nr:UPF0182 protein [Rhizoctonia solani]
MQSDQERKDNGKTKPPEATQAKFGGARGPFYQQSTHDKLASDQYGEELNHNASIWRMYAEEAKEQDAESVREKNENLNNLLLFATLFSAIVTAFIIESTSLLQQDSFEVSTQLLLALLQSQRRIETGMPDLTPFPIEIPTFKPSSVARLINVLWFSSLTISLGVAVIAILTKEWLTAFLAYKTRHAHIYALERQERLTNQKTWKMLPIIDLLPSLLNFALFLFGVGLIIRLWTLDFVVAGVISVISVGSGGIYFSFIVSGTLLKACPYKSQISRYSQKLIPEAILDHFDEDPSTIPDTSNEGYLNQKDLHILNWLIDNSWDPVLSTYVTQALAGLRSLRLQLGPGALPTGLETERISNLSSNDMKGYLDISLLFKLGAQAVDQLEILPTQGGNELALNGGSSAARLAIALSEIYTHALNWKTFNLEGTALATQQAQAYSSTQARENSWEETDSRACKITSKAFGGVDLFWLETSPALPPIAYAHLATAEIKMLRNDLEIMGLPKAEIPANPNHTLVDMPPSKFDHRGGNAASPATATTPGNATGTATAPEGTSAPAKTHEGMSQPIDGLWERYTRVLTRTALVIKSALNYGEISSSQELQYSLFDLLVQARMLIEEAGKYHIEFWRQIAKSTWNEEVSIRCITEKILIERVGCRRQIRNFELFESLVDLCGSYDITDNLRLEGFQVAGFQLLVVFWVDYFRKWMHKQHLPSHVESPTSWIAEFDQIVPQTPPYNQRTSADIVNHQYILLTHIAYTLGDFGPQRQNSNLPPSQDNVVDLILDLVISKFGTLVNAEERFKSYFINEDTRPSYQWIGKMAVQGWINHAMRLGSENSAKRNRRHKLCFCTLGVIELAGALIYDLTPAIAPRSEVETFLDLIHGALQARRQEATPPIMRNILDTVTSIINLNELGDREKEYFVSSRGFYILTKIGQLKTDRIAVGRIVHRILVHLYSMKARVSQEVILSLLEAMNFTYPEVTKKTKLSPYDPYILPSILFQLEALSDDSNPISYFVTEKASSIQVLLDWVEDWVRNHTPPWASDQFKDLFEDLPPTNPAILGPLKKQIQRRIDLGQSHWGKFSSDEYGAQYYRPDYDYFPKDQEPQKSVINPQGPLEASGNSAAPDPGVGAQSNVGATPQAASLSGAPQGAEGLARRANRTKFRILK